jgi:hypothetical protein
VASNVRIEKNKITMKHNHLIKLQLFKKLFKIICTALQISYFFVVGAAGWGLFFPRKYGWK